MLYGIGLVKIVREYLWFFGWVAAFAASTLFVEYERYVLIIFPVVAAVWLVLKIVTDHQEKKLNEDLGEMTEEEYSLFMKDAEKEGLVEKSPNNLRD